ncbi:MAG: globin [Pseudomonadales bacterium]|nr:globin [Pseudomonadales bacterium]
MTTELIMASLESAAEAQGDISPAIYENYFQRCPGSEALMSHIDHIVRGRMLEEVFRLLMADSLEAEAGYLNFEVNNHKLAYNVEPHMYGNLLQAVRDTVQTAAGNDWQEAWAQAWDQRIEELSGEISKRL